MKEYKIIFWDFDGVIKDSVDAKTAAFVKLFEAYGPDVMERVKQHHESNGGMSRYDKFPVYLSWVGQAATDEKIAELSKQFSDIVFSEVVNSKWVPGVEEYLRANVHEQRFVLVTATPHEEILQILDVLQLLHVFYKVYGSPNTKKESIKRTLLQEMVSPEDCLMIGDATADMEAAGANGVPFLLRLHNSNRALFSSYEGLTISDLTHISNEQADKN